MLKNEIRIEIRKLLARLDPDAVSCKSAAIFHTLFGLPEWRDSRAVLTFMGRRDEADTRPIITEALLQGKRVYVPRVEGDALIFHMIDALDDVAVLHPYGMFEPPHHLPRFPEDFTPPSKGLVLVPGLAFDRSGNRLGRGKGYYDRFLRGIETVYGRERFFFLGLCFSLQVIDTVPHDDADVAMDAVLTESGITR